MASEKEIKPGTLTGPCPKCGTEVGFNILEKKGQNALFNAVKEVVRHPFPMPIRRKALKVQHALLALGLEIEADRP